MGGSGAGQIGRDRARYTRAYPVDYTLSRSVPSLRRRLQEASEELRRLPGVTVSRIITAEELSGIAERCEVRFRHRLFPPFVTLWMFLWQALSPDGSCREAVFRWLADRGRGGGRTAGSAGYCLARKRLPLALVTQVSQLVAERLSAAVAKEHLWQGRRVKIVDGTTVSMPDTPANQARFPQQAGQKPGLGFPIARVLGVFCWSSGALLAHAMCAFKGKNASELGLLREVMMQFSAGDVVLGDRYFASYVLVALFQAQGVDVLFRQHQRRKVDFRKGKRLGAGDHLITLTKPKKCPGWLDPEQFAQLPATLLVREVRSGEWTLVTTLVDARCCTTAALCALYQSRWHCELDLRSIKQTLGMQLLRCQSPEMVEKELAVYLLAYNLLRALMLRAAIQAAVPPRMLSFKAAQQMLLAHGALLWLGEVEGALIATVLTALADERVGERPGRCEPRAIKRRPKPHRLLTKPRAQARRECSSHAS